jgi:hypothetical protein
MREQRPFSFASKGKLALEQKLEESSTHFWGNFCHLVLADEVLSPHWTRSDRTAHSAEREMREKREKRERLKKSIGKFIPFLALVLSRLSRTILSYAPCSVRF